MSYQGWKNYETWHTALCLDNEASTYNHAQNMASAIKDIALGDRRVIDGTWTAEEAARYNLSDSLSEWVEGMLPDLGGNHVASGLMQAAFDEIDWNEVADHYLES